MKKYLFILSFFIAGIGISPSISIDLHPKNQTVYVCNGSYATKYHLKRECRGLSNCKGGITKMSVEEAKKKGRTLCGWED